MKKYLIVTFIIIFLGIVFWLARVDNKKDRDINFQADMRKEKNNENLIRRAAVAGQFYPGQKSELDSQVEKFLMSAAPPQSKGEIIGLIVPHAGYQFSGSVAAYGYKKLMGEDIDTVILIGNSHYEYFDGVSVYPQGYFETPLGKVEIDSDLADLLIKENPQKIFFRESTHLKEHSLEVQIPFLQKTIKGDFRIVPILFGNYSKDDYKILAQAILKNIKGKNVLLVASSDLSHYPSYKDAQYADKKTLDSILTGDVEKFEKTIGALEKENIPNASTFSCADDSIKTLMVVAQGLKSQEIKLLKYANSGDIYPDKDQVVGYGAVGFFAERRGDLLNKDERVVLLKIARESVENFVRKKIIPAIEVKSEMLKKNLGAFVTIKENGNLRGCIGIFSPAPYPLFEIVSKMAIAAASEDSRFYPIQEEELRDLKYEISVLGELKKVEDWHNIRLKKEGVKIEIGNRSGVFLPQVAEEHNLNLEEFLGLLCQEKVGVERDCYKNPEAKIYTFTAQVFEESDKK